MEDYREHYVKCGGEKFLDMMDQAEASVLRAEVARLRMAADERDAALARAEKAEAKLVALNAFLGIDYLEAENERLREEKDRRVYYQDIVYAVCNSLDIVFDRHVSDGTGIVCGTLHEPSSEVQDHMRKCVAEIARLRAIVDKLPKTADGAVVTPGMYIYDQEEGGHVTELSVRDYEKYYTSSVPLPCYTRTWRCYSTREAAEAARKAGG